MNYYDLSNSNKEQDTPFVINPILLLNIFLSILLGTLFYYRLNKANAKLPRDLQTFDTKKRFIYLFCWLICPICCSGYMTYHYMNEIETNQRIAIENKKQPPPIQITEQVIRDTSATNQQVILS